MTRRLPIRAGGRRVLERLDLDVADHLLTPDGGQAGAVDSDRASRLEAPPRGSGKTFDSMYTFDVPVVNEPAALVHGANV